MRCIINFSSFEAGAHWPTTTAPTTWINGFKLTIRRRHRFRLAYQFRAKIIIPEKNNLSEAQLHQDTSSNATICALTRKEAQISLQRLVPWNFAQDQHTVKHRASNVGLHCTNHKSHRKLSNLSCVTLPWHSKSSAHFLKRLTLLSHCYKIEALSSNVRVFEIVWTSFLGLMWSLVLIEYLCLSPVWVVRYLSVIRLVFLILYLLLIRFTSSKLCCISKYTMKHQQNLDWNLGLLWFSFGCQKCMFDNSFS